MIFQSLLPALATRAAFTSLSGAASSIADEVCQASTSGRSAAVGLHPSSTTTKQQQHRQIFDFTALNGDLSKKYEERKLIG